MNRQKRKKHNLFIRCIVFLSLFCIICTTLPKISPLAGETVIAADESGASAISATGGTSATNGSSATDGTNVTNGTNVMIKPSFAPNTSDIVGINNTSDVFTSVGGQYSLRYFLSKYNVVSLEDIESTHIVGPILAVQTARRTPTSPAPGAPSVDYLAASDYARGQFSYVGSLTASDDDVKQSALTMNYKFDRIQSGDSYVPPIFYTKQENTTVYEDADHNENVLIDDGSDGDFLSPNDSGKRPTYLNDGFINVESLTSALVNQSDDLFVHGTIEDATIPMNQRFFFDGSNVYTGVTQRADGSFNYDGSTIVTGRVEVDNDLGGWPAPNKLTINLGESWVITDATNLGSVDLRTEDGNDFFETSYLAPTTINFLCEQINPYVNTGRGVTYSRFPLVYFNGSELDNPSNEDGEYSEHGNKIIWNMPNLVTNGDQNRLVPIRTGPNIPGHLIAPQAEFWNISYQWGDAAWEGGNINGACIFKSFHSGNTEVHMWPYDGEKQSLNAISHPVEITKTFNGEVPTSAYDFELDLKNPSAGIPDGIMNTVFPLYASTDADDYSNARFPELAFNMEGTYSFIVREVIPTDSASDHIDYDHSEYEVTITVQKIDGKFVVGPVVITKIEDEDGNPTNGSADTILFNNKSADGDTIDLVMTKQSSVENIGLAGAEFTLTELSGYTDSDVTIADGAVSVTHTSGESGRFTFKGLKRDTAYKLEETKAPEGYQKGKGYWIVVIDANGTLEAILARDGAKEVSLNNPIITNDKEGQETVYELPNTGGSTPILYYLIGSMLMLFVAIYRKKSFTK